MNVESILQKINLFEELVTKSGFKRDLVDFINALQQPQNRNIKFMTEVSIAIERHWMQAMNNSLPTELKLILKDSEPFTETDFLAQIEDINSDATLDAASYYNKLYGTITSLNQKMEVNITELNVVKNFFKKYSNAVDESLALDEQHALISLIFKDLQSTGSLKEFSKVLHRWNRALLVYHTLLQSDPPKDIEIAEIQNGSIDVVLNLNFDIAVDLASLVQTGMTVYGLYLAYKKGLGKQIIESYMGNQKLIANEAEREKLMLENVKESVYNKALEQHAERLKKDKKIEKTGVEKKAAEITRIITDHIVKGNSVKLMLPPFPDVDEEDGVDPDEYKEWVAADELSKGLRQATAVANANYKLLSTEDKQLLLDKYSIKEDGENK
ncbi:hypothetical protein [Nibribacter koreensis]|uniref:Uncharacterized protein n=1 Tax=Nibribacter koreensis TaxID=1084519 RepID=A0ABP8F5S8_9BACT